MLYERALMDKWDAYAVKKTAKEKLEKAMKEAMKEGMEKGMEKGIEKGIEKGMEKGMEKGVAQKSYEVVKKLLSAGQFTITEIAGFAGVSEDFVRMVKKRRK